MPARAGSPAAESAAPEPPPAVHIEVRETHVHPTQVRAPPPAATLPPPLLLPAPQPPAERPPAPPADQPERARAPMAPPPALGVERGAAERPRPESEPSVTITIGRLEVRALLPQPPAQGGRPVVQPHTSLRDYRQRRQLQRQQGG
jgi:hypothetical protein